MEIHTIKLGPRIRQLREQRGLTQTQLAAQIGVAQPTVNRWENDVRLPRWRWIDRLARTLGITVSDLLAAQ